MKWISIFDSRPKIGQKVLLYHPWGEKMNYKDVIVGWIQAVHTFESSENIEWVDSQYTPIEPTHWMPLPEPPK